MEMTLANIPESVTDICPNCGQTMTDGEPVRMSWNGEAIAHIECGRSEAANA